MRKLEFKDLLESVIGSLSIALRIIIITFLVLVLIESSFHYRKSGPLSMKTIVYHYNFTNSEGDENTLVVMSWQTDVDDEDKGGIDQWYR